MDNISFELTQYISNFFSTSSSLSSILDGISSIARQIDKRAKELDEKEAIVTMREENIKHRITELERAEMRMRSQEVYLEHLLKQLQEKEKIWAATEKRIEENVSRVSDSVKLNVGGQLFATTKGTLMKHKGSFFSSLVQSGTIKDDEVFIDRDPSEFGVILNFMRDGRMRKAKDIVELNFECSFFGLFPFDFLSSSFQDSLRSWLPGKYLNLIYQATLDGFRTADFHRQCDKRGSTLTIIHSKEGYIFGCYSPDDWQVTGNKTNPETFVFTLSNPLFIPPTRYLYNPRASSPSLSPSSSPPSSVSSSPYPSLHGHTRSHSSPSSPAVTRSLSPVSPHSPPSLSPTLNVPMSPTSSRRSNIVSSQFSSPPISPQNTLFSSSILAPSPTLIPPNTNIFQSPSVLNSFATPPRSSVREKHNNGKNLFLKTTNIPS